jgi:hypothetical protein
MSKVHIIANDSPLSEELSLTALCGCAIDRAVFLWTLEGDLRHSDVSTLGSCLRCRQVFAALPKKRIWLCGAMDAFETRQKIEEE